MSAIVSMFARKQSSGVNETQDVFGTSPVQRLVKDEVAFAPAPNPYSALQKAAERLQSGKSVFFENSEEAEHQLAVAKHA
ncbi:MAG TPA: hypothetical protein VFF74_00100 [Methylophilaceae bacterium]|nr:hypothetical protein [Methylophilaceae bacterium]